MCWNSPTSPGPPSLPHGVYIVTGPDYKAASQPEVFLSVCLTLSPPPPPPGLAGKSLILLKLFFLLEKYL